MRIGIEGVQRPKRKYIIAPSLTIWARLMTSNYYLSEASLPRFDAHINCWAALTYATHLYILRLHCADPEEILEKAAAWVSYTTGREK